MQVIKQDQVQEKIITIRGHQIIIDSDVAELYGIETKQVNQAVKNNPEKFPPGKSYNGIADYLADEEIH
jgi:ORF6N domain